MTPTLDLKELDVNFGEKTKPGTFNPLYFPFSETEALSTSLQPPLPPLSQNGTSPTCLVVTVRQVMHAVDSWWVFRVLTLALSVRPD